MLFDFPETGGDITRIEFEPLGTGAFRWNLFAGDVRVHSEIARRETLEAIFATTAALCTFPNYPGGEQP